MYVMHSIIMKLSAIVSNGAGDAVKKKTEPGLNSGRFKEPKEEHTHD